MSEAAKYTYIWDSKMTVLITEVPLYSHKGMYSSYKLSRSFKNWGRFLIMGGRPPVTIVSK